MQSAVESSDIIISSANNLQRYSLLILNIKQKENIDIEDIVILSLSGFIKENVIHTIKL